MGNEATVRARVNGKADSGRALLESHEVVFRGAQRCVVKLDEKSRAKASAAGAWLKLGVLELELGAVEAGKWLEKIRKPKSVLEKLGVKAGQRVKLIDVTDRALFERSGAELVSDAPEVIFFEVTAPADLKRLPKVAGDQVLWLLRQKGKNAPVSERETMAAGKASGLVDVKVVSVSNALTAEKYVVPLKLRALGAETGAKRPRSPGRK
ncbi:MAG: hypothetical protein JNK82_38725 [Myxococcaceae bacterium]|nr:hypothetical protein [Myxococcaceae bacterium]